MKEEREKRKEGQAALHSSFNSQTVRLKLFAINKRFCIVFELSKLSCCKMYSRTLIFHKVVQQKK